jgi:predicted phage tail protein
VELRPNPSLAVAPLSFSVDTRPPAAPSQPVLSSYSDSGIVGDGITTYRNVNFTGTSEPGVSIQLYAGFAGVGGALADATGHWSSTTTALADGTYTITAAAFDSAGNKSPLSMSTSLTIGTAQPVAATAPGAPTLNSATAGSGQVVLAWSAPSSNGGSAITGYTATASPGGATCTAGGTGTGCTVTGLTNGITYSFTVRATNGVGTGAASTALSATPAAAATAPGAPTLNSATAGNGQVALGWSAPASNGGSAITGYRVYRSTSSGTETLLTTLGAVTSWINTGLANGTTYYYKVSAVNGIGAGGQSGERSATPAASVTVPSAPTLTSAIALNGQVALFWTPPSSTGGSPITGYKVYRSTSSGTETLFTTLGAVTSWINTGLANGTTYYYKVSAVNGIGEGGQSGERFATPAASVMVPGAPTNLVATANSKHGITLTWLAPSSTGGSAITSYRIYRGTASGGETLLATVGTATTYADSGMPRRIPYYYKVAAVNAVGVGAMSPEASASAR